MEELRRHEVFEIEALYRMNSARLLEPLVFGGGTMLRLCYGLNRYSVDLDFWIVKNVDEKAFLENMKKCFRGIWEITDSCVKRSTILAEIRAANYPRLLKIEVRRGVSDSDWQETIAFSQYDTRQVLVKAHTLEYCMERKVRAALERKEIRDVFDIEFMLKRGVGLPQDKKDLEELRKLINKFGKKDLKVSLGSFLEAKDMAYYSANGFAFLEGKLNEAVSAEGSKGGG